MSRIFVFSFAIIALVALTLRADDKKELDVKELDLKDLKRDIPKAGFDKPTVITSEDELKKAFSEEDVQARLKKAVDFSKQQLVFFAWSGSGGDILAFDVTKGSASEEVAFKYVPGRTKDLRSHFHLFVLPKDATWKISK